MNPKAKSCLFVLWICLAAQIALRVSHAMGSTTASATADMMVIGGIIVGGRHEPIISDGQLEFKGTHKQLDEELWDREMSLPKEATYISIEGGFNWAANVRDIFDNYEPWVGEWSVTIWERKQ